MAHVWIQEHHLSTAQAVRTLVFVNGLLPSYHPLQRQGEHTFQNSYENQSNYIRIDILFIEDSIKFVYAAFYIN